MMRNASWNMDMEQSNIMYLDASNLFFFSEHFLVPVENRSQEWPLL